MKHETISERLIAEKICNTTLSSNTTAMYAIQWMHGAHMDLNKKQVQTHRARLRKIGIDIGIPCDLSRFSPIFVKQVCEIEVRDLPVPQWYQRPYSQIRLVA